MKAFFEKFEVRWADLDANRHLGNSSYMNFCSQTRMAFLNFSGFGIGQLVQHNLAPVILKEDFIFYKEIYADQTIYVSLETTGLSEDGNIFIFTHKLYDKTGVHHATSKVIGVWIDMIQRKRIAPPEELKNAMLTTNNPDNIKTVTIEDIKTDEKPSNLDTEFLISNYYKH